MTLPALAAGRRSSDRATWLPHIFLGLLAGLHGLLYLLLIPPWQAPDETSHVEHALLWRKLGRTATAADAAAAPEIGAAIARSLYTFRAYDYLGYPTPEPRAENLRDMPFFGSSTTLGRFSLAYPLYALAVIPFQGAEVETQLYVMRLVSVLIGAATVVLSYATARRIAPGAPELAAGLGVLLIFIPQRASINAAVNDGNLAELLTAAVFYGLIVLIQDGLTWRRAAGCALAAAAAVLTKGTALFLTPLLGVIGVWWLAQAIRRRQRAAWPLMAAVLGASAMLAVVLVWSPARGPAQAVLARGGDGLQQAITQRLAEGTFATLQWQTFRSFWANLGWLRVSLPEPVYVFLLALVVVGLAGLPLGGWTLLARGQPGVGLALALGAILCWLVPTVVYFVAPTSAPLHQGRYLFPGLIPFGLLVLAGWLGPARRPQAVMLLLSCGLALLDSFALFIVAIPYFYG